ncbi:MAG: hypothetical protein IT384_32845 [Deltaproteobacteria bacterium]|nr:hypothetical protein [Deltaproteobacteria bacterium]
MAVDHQARMTCAVLLLAGCASGARGPTGRTEPTAGDYAPLAVGSSWTYEVAYPLPGEQTVKLVAEKDGFILDDQSGAFRLTPNGLRDRDRFLLRNPIAVGTHWKTVVGPSAVEHAEITSVGEACTATAGKFDDCVVVHAWIRRDAQLTLHIEWTWARGVGLVRVETAAEIKGRGRVPQTKQSLKRFVPGGSASPAAPQPGGQQSEESGAPDRWEN